MQDNIDKVMQRGERLDDLRGKTGMYITNSGRRLVWGWSQKATVLCAHNIVIWTKFATLPVYIGCISYIWCYIRIKMMAYYFILMRWVNTHHFTSSNGDKDSSIDRQLVKLKFAYTNYYKQRIYRRRLVISAEEPTKFESACKYRSYLGKIL